MATRLAPWSQPKSDVDFAFEERGHTVVPSAHCCSTTPRCCSSTRAWCRSSRIFGEAVPPYERAASVQKVVRTLDIEEVGKTTRHASFFQMCGNFSFMTLQGTCHPVGLGVADQACQRRRLRLPEDRLRVTVYEDDDEAAQLWEQIVPAERIQRRGMLDNFWSMGAPTVRAM